MDAKSAAKLLIDATNQLFEDVPGVPFDLQELVDANEADAELRKICRMAAEV